MGEIIYWKKYDEPIRMFDPVLKCERERLGEFVCKDERVIYFDFVGGFSPTGPTIRCYAVFVFKDGSEHREEINLAMPMHELMAAADPEKMQQDFYILQAEQYLQSLTK